MKTPFFHHTRLNAELQRLFASGHRTQINAEMPEWIQLAPYGEWPTSERDADGKPEGVQVFTRDDATALVKRFNAWHRRLGRLARINSCKAYIGHPDFAPDIWPARVELGDVVELSDDEHGLNGRMRWNADVDEQLQKNPFPSVAWDTDVYEPGRERPVMLWSVGMTAKPNIKGVKSAINASPETEPPTHEPAMNLLAQIKALLISSGLLKETDTDEAVLSGVNATIQSVIWQRQTEARNAAMYGEIKTALNSAEDKPLDELFTALVASHASLQTAATDRETRLNAATTEAAALNERINALTAERDEARTARLNAVLDRLVETGRLSKAEVEAEGDDSVRARFNADFDKALGELTAKAVRLNTSGLNLGREKPGMMDATERITRLNIWVGEHMTRHNCDHAAAWEASKNDPEMKKLHQAMEDADKQRATEQQAE